MTTDPKKVLMRKSAGTADAEPELLSYLDCLLAQVGETADRENDSQTKVTSIKAATECQESVKRKSAGRVGTEVPSLENVPAFGHAEVEIEYPAWAGTPFQVLMFEVAGITLAAPLISLLGILKLDCALSRIPGQPVWQLGVINHRSRKIGVVDTARLIMPEMIHSGRGGGGVEKGYLLLIGSGDIGIRIEEIRDTVVLDRRAVQWRKQTLRQPWLAGIITEQLTVLLNVDVLFDMIRQA